MEPLVFLYSGEIAVRGWHGACFQSRWKVLKYPGYFRTIFQFFDKFQRIGSFTDELVGVVHLTQTVGTPGNVARIAGVIQHNQRKSNGRVAKESKLKRSRNAETHLTHAASVQGSMSPSLNSSDCEIKRKGDEWCAHHDGCW